MGQGLSLALFVGVPLVQGIVAGLTTADEVKTWFSKLKQPRWRPPNWVFGPVWTALYTTMGVASWLVWRDGGFSARALPLTLYGVHLLFNFAWTPLFFKAHRLDLALADLAVMLGFSVAATVEYFKVNPVAGYLMVPYIGWQVFAAALNYKIWRDNPKAGQDGPSTSGTTTAQHIVKSK